MAWTFIGAAKGVGSTGTTLNVQDGDLLVALIDYNSSTPDNSFTVSGATNSLAVQAGTAAEWVGALNVAYKEVASANSAETFTCSNSGYGLMVLQWRPPSGTTATFDAISSGAFANSGNTITSGTLSTSAPALVIGAFEVHTSTVETPTITIGGAAADAYDYALVNFFQPTAGWKEFTTTQSNISSTLTRTSSTILVAQSIAFIATSSGPPDVTPNSISASVSVGRPNFLVPSTSGISVFRASPGGTLNRGAGVLVNEVLSGVSGTIADDFWGLSLQPSVTPSSISAPVDVGTPSVQQNHALTPSPIAASVSVGTPSVQQNHALTTNSVSASVSLGQPAITSGTAVTPSSISASVNVGAPSLTQNHVVTANSISSAVAITQPTIQQNSALSANSISTSVVNGTATITQNHVLGAQSVTVSVTNGQPTVILAGAIQPVSISIPVSAGSPGLSQNHIFGANSVSVGVAVSIPTIMCDQRFGANNLSVGVLIGTPALAQNHLFTNVSISSAVVLGKPAVVPSGASPIYLCINGAWRTGDQFVAVDGAWHQAYQFNLNVNHAWKS